MKNKINNLQFDVALIGAGAYGLPLASFIKRMGKKAIHLGGVLQLFFGIQGKAWDSWKIYNKFWTKPKLSEQPEGY